MLWKNKTFGVIKIFILLQSIVFAQTADSTYQLIQSINTEAAFFTTDNLHQIYLVNSNNDILKLNSDGLEVFRFSNNTLGDLALLDAGNPFNLLLYYPEFQNLITLDRTLNQTGQINLFNLDFLQVKAVGMSKDNRIWLFVNLNNQLKKIDIDGTTVMQSDDLRLLLGQSIQATFLIEREQQIFVNDPNIGILVFDDFGQYIKTLDFKGLQKFQVIGEKLLFVEAGNLKAFNLQSLLMERIKLPEGVEVENLEVQKNRLYELRTGVLNIYSF